MMYPVNHGRKDANDPSHIIVDPTSYQRLVENKVELTLNPQKTGVMVYSINGKVLSDKQNKSLPSFLFGDIVRNRRRDADAGVMDYRRSAFSRALSTKPTVNVARRRAKKAKESKIKVELPGGAVAYLTISQLKELQA